MCFGDGIKDSVPVRAAKVSRSPKGSNGIPLSTNILDDNVVHLIFFQFGSQIYVDLDAVLGVLFFNGMEEGVEPLGSAEVTNDPSEVYLFDRSVVVKSLVLGSRKRTLESRVGFDLWRLFIRYQIVLRILRRFIEL